MSFAKHLTAFGYFLCHFFDQAKYFSVAFFLVGTAVFGHQLLELPEQLECRRKVPLVAMADRAHVERVGILRLGLEQRLEVAKRFVEALRDDLLLCRSEYVSGQKSQLIRTPMVRGCAYVTRRASNTKFLDTSARSSVRLVT